MLCLTFPVCIGDSATVYVDDDADPSWYDASHVATLTEGITNVSDGGTIYLWDGTYIESIDITKSVDIIGNGTGSTFVYNSGSIGGGFEGLTDDGGWFCDMFTGDIWLEDCHGIIDGSENVNISVSPYSGSSMNAILGTDYNASYDNNIERENLYHYYNDSTTYWSLYVSMGDELSSYIYDDIDLELYFEDNAGYDNVVYAHFAQDNPEDDLNITFYSWRGAWETDYFLVSDFNREDWYRIEITLYNSTHFNFQGFGLNENLPRSDTSSNGDNIKTLYANTNDQYVSYYFDEFVISENGGTAVFNISNTDYVNISDVYLYSDGTCNALNITNVSHMEITDCAFYNNPTCIYLDAFPNNINISNCVFDTFDNGIRGYKTYMHNFSVYNSSFANSTDFGIYCSGDFNDWNALGNAEINENVFENVYQAIEIAQSYPVMNNTDVNIIGNDIYNATESGIDCDLAYGDMNISHNYLYHCQDYGIAVFGADVDDEGVQNLYCYNNTVYMDNDGIGITVAYVDNFYSADCYVQNATNTSNGDVDCGLWYWSGINNSWVTNTYLVDCGETGNYGAFTVNNDMVDGQHHITNMSIVKSPANAIDISTGINIHFDELYIERSQRHGIYMEDGTLVNFSNSEFYPNYLTYQLANYDGINSVNNDNITFWNCTFQYCEDDCIILDTIDNITIYDSSFYDFSNDAVYIESGKQITIEDSYIDADNTSGTNGVYLLNSDNATLDNNDITQCKNRGVYLFGTDNSTVLGNTVYYNGLGINVTGNNNIVYNNYFANTVNGYDGGIGNLWNISKTPGSNVIGGSYIMGNYWSDYSGIDTDGDGIGETPYSI